MLLHGVDATGEQLAGQATRTPDTTPPAPNNKLSFMGRLNSAAAAP